MTPFINSSYSITNLSIQFNETTNLSVQFIEVSDSIHSFIQVYHHRVGKALEYMVTDALTEANSFLKIGEKVDDPEQ